MSLHTRYRPSRLEEVIGQDVAVKSLKRTIKDARQHSFIFTGPPGTGKTTLARILAGALCGSGDSNLNIEEVDGASRSTAENARDLVGRSVFRSIGANPNKFIIIDEAHRLSSAAWTIMLKPIEEPPQHVYYALCTTDPTKIPKAIMTRCVRYDLKPVKEELLLGLLCDVADKEKLEVSDEIIECIVENAGGSPRQALVYLETCAGCASANEARAMMRDAGQSKEVIDLARWLVNGKGRNWAEAMKYVKAVSGEEAESVRIKLVNYFAAVLVNAKSEKMALPVLQLMECFSKPYITSDKQAPLLYSVAMALGMDK
jgi:DNA polymerase-3 subunit gamma/tau